MSTLPIPTWSEDAACTQSDPEAWFPGPGHGGEDAKIICREECPLTESCLQYALDNVEVYGIWGGLDPRERNAMLHPHGSRRYRERTGCDCRPCRLAASRAVTNARERKARERVREQDTV